MELLVISLWLIIIPSISAQPSCNDGDLRLQQTVTLTSLNAGRLEICRNGVWGSIQAPSSTSFWSEKNILVACRQVGLIGGLNSVPANQLSLADRMSETSPLHLSNVACDGTETRILDCVNSALIGTNSHNRDVYIVCLPGIHFYTGLHSTDNSVGDVRLVGSNTNGEGAVEILTTLGWSSICPDSSWEDSDALAVCQNLGYESGQTFNTLVDPSVIAPRLVNDSRCINSSMNRPSTSFSRIQAGDCNFLSSTCSLQNNIFAGVSCSTSSVSESVRLIISSDDLGRRVFEGVVEILYDGRWGVLCRGSMDTEIAGSVCEGLGYERNHASLVTYSSQKIKSVESRLKPLWIPSITCSSSSESLSDCSLLMPLGYGTCTDRNGDGLGEILTVNCGRASSGSLSSVSTVVVVFVVLIVVGSVSSIIFGKNRNRSSRSRSTHIAAIAIASSSGQPSSYPAATRPADSGSSETEPTAEPEKPELTQPPPPSYQESSKLSKPKEDELPPPYDPSSNPNASPPPIAPPSSNLSAPPPTNPSAPPPPINPAYPPPTGGNAAYPPPGRYPPPTGGNSAYPPPGSYPPPTEGNATYPPPAQAYPPPEVYPPSVGNPAYPPPPGGNLYPPADTSPYSPPNPDTLPYPT